MKAVIVHTHTNYRNLNGLELPVKEVSGNRVTVTVTDPETGMQVDCDFRMREVRKIIR